MWTTVDCFTNEASMLRKAIDFQVRGNAGEGDSQSGAGGKRAATTTPTKPRRPSKPSKLPNESEEEWNARLEKDETYQGKLREHEGKIREYDEQYPSAVKKAKH